MNVIFTCYQTEKLNNANFPATSALSDSPERKQEKESFVIFTEEWSTFSSVYIKKYPQYASTFFVDTPSLAADAENQNFYIFSLSPFHKKLQKPKTQRAPN